MHIPIEFIFNHGTNHLKFRESQNPIFNPGNFVVNGGGLFGEAFCQKTYRTFLPSMGGLQLALPHLVPNGYIVAIEWGYLGFGDMIWECATSDIYFIWSRTTGDSDEMNMALNGRKTAT